MASKASGVAIVNEGGAAPKVVGFALTLEAAQRLQRDLVERTGACLVLEAARGEFVLARDGTLESGRSADRDVGL